MGKHQPPGGHRVVGAPLADKEEMVAAVLRNRDGVRPVYVSLGHLVSLETACARVLRRSPRRRLPETARAADHTVRSELRRSAADSSRLA